MIEVVSPLAVLSTDTHLPVILRDVQMIEVLSPLAVLSTDTNLPVIYESHQND